MLLQISSGQGPVECSVGVEKELHFLKQKKSLAFLQGFSVVDTELESVTSTMSR